MFYLRLNEPVESLAKLPLSPLHFRSCVVAVRVRVIQSVQTSSPYYFGVSYLWGGSTSFCSSSALLHTLARSELW